jgi:hypothetical protein
MEKALEKLLNRRGDSSTYIGGKMDNLETLLDRGGGETT